MTSTGAISNFARTIARATAAFVALPANNTKNLLLLIDSRSRIRINAASINASITPTEAAIGMAIDIAIQVLSPANATSANAGKVANSGNGSERMKMIDAVLLANHASFGRATRNRRATSILINSPGTMNPQMKSG